MAFAGIVQAIVGVVQMVTALISAIKAVAKLSYDGFKGLITGEDNTEDIDKQLEALKRAGATGGSGINNVIGGNVKAFQGVVGAFGSDSAAAAQKHDREAPWMPVSAVAPGAVAGAGGPSSNKVQQDNKIEINQYGVSGENVTANTKTGLGGALGGALNDAKQVFGRR